jgi:hypothetical protein
VASYSPLFLTVIATLVKVSIPPTSLQNTFMISCYIILRILNQVLPRPRAAAEPLVVPLDTFRVAVVDDVVVPLPGACPRLEKEVLDDRPWPARTLPLFVPREPLIPAAAASAFLFSSSAFFAAASLRCCISSSLLSAACCFCMASFSISAMS